MNRNAGIGPSTGPGLVRYSLLCWVLAASTQMFAQVCLDCHEDKRPAASTAHAPLECSTCHLQHEEYPHPAGAETKGCETCHSLEADQTAAGVHSQQRQNDVEVGCTVCHGTAHEVDLLKHVHVRRLDGDYHSVMPRFLRETYPEAVAVRWRWPGSEEIEEWRWER